MAEQEYDNRDRGYLVRNDDRKTKSHPSHKGKLTISYETLRALMRQMKEEETAILYFSAWPGKQAGSVNFQAEAPSKYREDQEAPPQRASSGRGNSNSNSRQSSQARRPAPQQAREDDFDDEVPF